MTRRSRSAVTALITAALLASCADNSSTNEKSNATTTSAESAAAAAPETSSSRSAAPDPTVGETAAEPEDLAVDERVPTAACATDYTLYQPGTTFYSDGTSGYTEACQAGMESLMRQSGQFPDYTWGDYPDPDYPEHIIGRTPDGAAIRDPEVQEEANAGHQWWSDCIAVNDAETCRANDPWQ